MRVFVRTLAVLFALSLAGVSAAQTPPDWGIWAGLLYDPINGTVYRYDSTGTVTPSALPLPADMQQTPPTNVAASRDGNTLVYLTYNAEWQPGGGPYDARMTVFNTQTNIADEYPFLAFNVHSLNYFAAPSLFGPDNRTLAIGYHQPSGWTIALLDVVNRQYGATLSEADTPAQTIIAPGTRPYEQPVPVITAYDGTWVEFMMVPGEAFEIPPALNSYAWNPATGEVRQTTRFSSFAFDYWPATGEVIRTEQDENRPFNPGFPFGHNNVLTAISRSDTATPFYTSQQYSFNRPHFIQGGEKVLFSGIVADTPGDTWTALPRTGPPATVISSPASGMDLGILDAASTPYGALVIGETAVVSARLGLQLEGGLTAVHIDTRDETPTALDVVFNTPPDVTFAQFIWSSSTLSDTIDYAPWQPLDGAAVVAPPTPTSPALVTPPPTIAAAATTVPAAAPTQAAPLLSAGQAALVFTTEGDNLNVRSGPGAAFEVVGQVANGETVTLLEGPFDAEGLNWWRVRTPAGVEGWTVESAEGVQTLQPTTLPDAALPTPVSQRLTVGGQAVVALAPSDAANLRREPSLSAPIDATLLGGTELNVIGGPIEAEGLVWWQVTRQTGGVSGWVVEATNGLIVLDASG